ncbi:unnamed protein product [Soboliphyme baturini]|uniref:Phorbol-ester/DAG-type domain-containing protein n=1 Tax=Soboliphyme baturini TaxID=241478 RepID=A0A183J6K5_9BILA|nr:unnamed protein product [Soboliphyme baturini]
MITFFEDEDVPRVFFINGHEFISSRRNLTGGYIQYCEQCCCMIWTFLQKWQYCRLCGYCAHKRCISRICQCCVSVLVIIANDHFKRLFKVNENPAYELSICPEQGLFIQKYRCRDCREPILIDTMKPAILCDYSGYYYCGRCHWNETAVIPARVIHNWDFEPRPVRLSLEHVCSRGKQLNVVKCLGLFSS